MVTLPNLRKGFVNVTFQSPLQNLIGSLSKIKGPNLSNFAQCYLCNVSKLVTICWVLHLMNITKESIVNR